MSASADTVSPLPAAALSVGARRAGPEMAAPIRYGLSLLLVGAATIIAFVVDTLIGPSNLALVFVLPVVVAAVSFGWGPALVAAVASVLAFDFFFVQPRYTLLVANPADVWALALLLVTAAIVSTVAAQARRRALEAAEAAEQADALRELAHAVVHGASRDELLRAAAAALTRMFQAPAVVLVERGETFETAAVTQGAELTAADMAAAKVALSSALATRGGVYPTDSAAFDFWPVSAGEPPRVALGVNFEDADKDRPRNPERLVEIVSAYLTLARGRTGA
jgi:K+-sensing histidine kinase KdpD